MNNILALCVGNICGRCRGQAIARLDRGVLTAWRTLAYLVSFSTENWKRPAEEVTGLMVLFLLYLQKEASDMSKKRCAT